MPTYEYQCDDCGHNFDEFQMFSEAPLTVCPKCGKSTLRRVFGAGAAIIFKGSGFYETDYRSDSYKAAAKKDQETSAGTSGTASSSGTSGSGDAKPAAPAASSPPPAAGGNGAATKSS